MDTSVVTIKGQIVIPAKLRRKYNLKKGTKVALIEQDGKLFVQPLTREYFENLAGILGDDGKMLQSLKEEKQKEREL